MIVFYVFLFFFMICFYVFFVFFMIFFMILLWQTKGTSNLAASSWQLEKKSRAQQLLTLPYIFSFRLRRPKQTKQHQSPAVSDATLYFFLPRAAA